MKMQFLVPSTKTENLDNLVKFLYQNSDIIKTYFGIEIMLDIMDGQNIIIKTL